MGVNTRILLPPTAQIEHVGIVAAMLAGCEFSFAKAFPTAREDSRCVRLAKNALKLDSTNDPALTIVKMTAPKDKTLVDGETIHHCYWHWEPDRAPNGYHSMSPTSTSFWIAIGKGLVDFFGGMVDYSDCDDRPIDYVVSEQNNWHSDGDAFYDYHERMCKVQPLQKMAEHVYA